MTTASALASRRATSLPVWAFRPRSREPCPTKAFRSLLPCRPSRAVVVDSCASRLPRWLPVRSRGPRREISARAGSPVASARTRKLAGSSGRMACATDVRTDLSTPDFQRRYPTSVSRLVVFLLEGAATTVLASSPPTSFRARSARRTTAVLWQTTREGPTKTTTDNDTIREHPSGTDICSSH